VGDAALGVRHRLAQVALCAALIGAAAALLLGQRMETALVLGMVLSLSSTAVVMQLLGERKETGSRLGQAVFAILMLQDLAVVPILILIGAWAAARPAAAPPSPGRCCWRC
jgi:CPA2 family monovalent cation:H+ antiporter-2